MEGSSKGNLPPPLKPAFVSGEYDKYRKTRCCFLASGCSIETHMKKQFFISLAIAVLLVPQVSLAAWWNPLTWFKKPVAPPFAKVVQVATTTSQTNPAVTNPTPAAKKETPATVVKYKVTPPTKTVDQSDEIEKLKKEVEELKERQRNTQRVPNQTIPEVKSAVTEVATPTYLPPVEDSYLKVEQCKADRDAFRARLDAQIPSLVKLAYTKCVHDSLEKVKILLPNTSASTLMEVATAPCRNQERNTETLRSGFDKEANERYQQCLQK